MPRNNQKVLELHSLLSKILDSLCFELAVTHPDSNSLSLLEILMWRKSNEINQSQLKQLYKGWLEARQVLDIFTTKQTQIYDKSQLFNSPTVQQHLMNIKQVTSTLQILDSIYNQLYLSKNPTDRWALEAAQQLFGYLDNNGLIHLRLSSLFFVSAGILICQNYSIPISYDTFKVHFMQLRQQMCQINGMVSLRWFKNYMLNHPQRNIILKNIMGVLNQIEKCCSKHRKNQLPNLMDEAMDQWKQFPRFSNGSSRSRIEIYRRVFEENQCALYDEDVDQMLDHFNQKYGEQFIKCFEIDAFMLREFSTILRESFNRYLDIVRKIPNNKTKIPKIDKIEKTEPNKPYKKINKTPTKNHRKMEEYSHHTPTQRNQRVYLQRQFGSAERDWDKNINARTYTPTKSTQINKLNKTNQKIVNKTYVQGNNLSMHLQTLFFRNKRVESYDTVMKRLKKKS